MPGRRSLSALVIVGLLAATAIATVFAYRTERDAARDADQARARQVALAARQNVTILVAGLRGATAIVAPDGEIDPERFRSFARDVLSRTPFARLSWSRPVEESERAAFEAELGVPISHVAGGEFVPVAAGAGRRFLPVSLVYPNNALGREGLGFDLLSDPVLASAVRSALRRRTAVLSSPLELARPGEAGAVIYNPVFAPGAGDRIAGVLSTRVSGSALAGAVRDQLGLNEQITISDGNARLAGGPLPEDAASMDVSLLGRDWTVASSGVTQVNLTPVIAYGASGLALTLVAIGLVVLAARREGDLVHRRADAERLAARESLQVRITEAVEREIEVHGRLASLARTLVPAVGDICVVHDVTAAGQVRRVGVAAPDESTAELIRSLPEPDATSPIRAAISSREPVLYTRVSENREAKRARERGILDPLEDGEPGLSAEELLRADRVSNMIVPLVARDRVLGTISLSVLGSTGRPPLTRDDLAFAMEVATHAAVALDNARLYEQQRDIAGILQSALIPRALPEVAGTKVAARHRAGMTGTEVGGDFYDLFEVGGRWMAVVGDVCGKGPEAAALTALARHTVRATARLGPAGAVERVHEAIKALGEMTYCTLCCVELAPGPHGLDARVTTAGHPEPRIVRGDGSVRRLKVTGPIVGALDHPSFGSQDVHLEPGELLFMCSDGVPEARRNGEVFGDHRLEALLSALAGDEPAAMLERLEQEVVRFVEGRPRDDLALFALRVNG